MQLGSGRLGLDFGGGLRHSSLYIHWVMQLLFFKILIVYDVDVVEKWSFPPCLFTEQYERNLLWISDRLISLVVLVACHVHPFLSWVRKEWGKELPITFDVHKSNKWQVPAITAFVAARIKDYNLNIARHSQPINLHRASDVKIQGQRFCPGVGSSNESSWVSTGNDASGRQCPRLAKAMSGILQIWPSCPT